MIYHTKYDIHVQNEVSNKIYHDISHDSRTSVLYSV